MANVAVGRLRRETKAFAQRGLDALGYEIHRRDFQYQDFDAELSRLWDRVAPYTLTSKERIAAVVSATEYIARKGIPGDFVECGVWHGGSVMAMALTLQRNTAADRRLWLYDTFTHMPHPGAEDVDFRGEPMQDEWAKHAAAGVEVPTKGMDDVRAALSSTGYDAALITLVEGLVEETIPAQAPERIALLRLDTDWYQSTRHELEHLYPRLAVGGVLIVDDYGHFRGAKQAVDEFFADDPVLLHRIDYSGRMAIKLGE